MWFVRYKRAIRGPFLGYSGGAAMYNKNSFVRGGRRHHRGKHGMIWDMDTERDHVVKYPDSPLRRRKTSGDAQGREWSTSP